MSDDAVYGDDESIGELRSAWNAGDKGATSGSRDLDQREMSIVEQSVARLEGRPTVHLQVVSSGTTATTDFPNDRERTSPVDQVEDEAVTGLEYRVG